LVDEIGKDAFSVGAKEDLEPELYPRKLPLFSSISASGMSKATNDDLFCGCATPR